LARGAGNERAVRRRLAVALAFECDLLLKAALRTPGHWTRLRRRLDPPETLIKKARTRPIGRVINR
jgi:hypothetical protein